MKTESPRRDTRIALVLYWFDKAGGMEKHVSSLALALDDRGLDVRVFAEHGVDERNQYVCTIRDKAIPLISPTFDVLKGSKNAFTRKVLKSTVNAFCTFLAPAALVVHSIFRNRESRLRARCTWKYMRSSAGGNWQRRLAQLSLCTSHYRRPVHLVHVHGFRIEMGWAIRWGRDFDIPCVYTEHSTVSDWLGFHNMDPDSVRLCDLALSMTHGACTELKNLTGVEAVMRTRHILPEQPRLRHEPESPVPKRLICVSELKPIKQVYPLVAAFLKVLDSEPELELHIVGDGEQRDAIERLLEWSVEAQRVILHGRLSNSEALALIGRCDFMVLPSRSEGLSLSLLEALSCGVPVIARKHASSLELIQPGYNGFLYETNDPDALVEKILLAVRHPDLPGIRQGATETYSRYAAGPYSPADEMVDYYDLAAARHRKTCSSVYSNTHNGPLLTVVIPTCRPRFLDNTLDALAAQFDPRFEVIVVENGSALKKVALSVASRSDLMVIRLVRLAEAGVNRARNVGIAEARGRIIALLDDDAIPTPGWTHEVVQAHRRNPNAGVIGGRIRLRCIGGSPEWLIEPFRSILSEVDHGEEERWIHSPEWLSSMNLSFRRILARDIGGFREDFGPSGDSFRGCNDEIEFLRRIEAKGETGILFARRMEVAHLIPEERLTLRHMAEKFQRQGFSDLQLQHPTDRPDSWRDHWKSLFHAWNTRAWLRWRDVDQASMSKEARDRHLEYLVCTRAAFLHGMQVFVENYQAPCPALYKMAASRSRYTKLGEKWVSRRLTRSTRDRMGLAHDLLALLTRPRFVWARSDDFTCCCVFGRIDFVRTILERAWLEDPLPDAGSFKIPSIEPEPAVAYASHPA